MYWFLLGAPVITCVTSWSEVVWPDRYGCMLHPGSHLPLSRDGQLNWFHLFLRLRISPGGLIPMLALFLVSIHLAPRRCRPCFQALLLPKPLQQALGSRNVEAAQLAMLAMPQCTFSELRASQQAALVKELGWSFGGGTGVPTERSGQGCPHLHWLCFGSGTAWLRGMVLLQWVPLRWC